MLKFCQSNKIRAETPSGDNQLMIMLNETGRIINRNEFLKMADMSPLLEEGWTADDCLYNCERYFAASLPDGSPVVGFIDAGGFCLFSETGELPDVLTTASGYSRELQQFRFDSLGWTLLPLNSPFLKLDIEDKERVLVRANGFNVFQSELGCYRFQKVAADGSVVGGLYVKDNVADTIYTNFSARGQGIAFDLYNLARQWVPDLELSKIRTDAGESWVKSLEPRLLAMKNTEQDTQFSM